MEKTDAQYDKQVPSRTTTSWFDNALCVGLDAGAGFLQTVLSVATDAPSPEVGRSKTSPSRRRRKFN